MKIKIFIFSVEALQFFEVYENEAKGDKPNFKRGLTVTFLGQRFLKLLEKMAWNSETLPLFVIKQPNY